jgi:putative hemolysin
VIWTILGVLAVPLLVLVNAMFVAAEFSLVSVRRTQVEELIKARRVGSVAMKRAIDHMDDAIAATQLGITLASLALGWIGEPCIVRVLEPLLGFMPESWHSAAGHGLATAIAFALITGMHLILGELVPKAVSLQRPDTVGLWVAKPLLWFASLMRPFITVITALGNGVLRLLGFEAISGREMVHSVEELGLLIEETRRAGVLPRDAAQYVANVFRLRAKKVRDCMVPLDRMAALELHMPE